MPLPPAWLKHLRARALAPGLVFASCFTSCGDDEPSDVRARDSGTLDAKRAEADTDADASLMDAAPADAAPADAELADAELADAEADAAIADAAPADAAPADAALASPSFAMRVVVTGLAAPWELTLGPDDALWVSERTGKRVTRVDPATGNTSALLQLDDAYQASAQDGLLGLVLQPDSDLVYLAYTYDADASATLDRRAKIVRYRHVAATLVEPAILLDQLPASSDHNSGRLALGPDGALYYSLGDQGKNQFDLKCERIRAQELPTQGELDAHDWSKYQGKILRLALDGSIPQDNPLIAGVRSHVFSYGHRNAQGLAFTADGTLYASEQGPKTDDELNQIVPGRNYGWPHVAGFRDDRAYVYGDWSAASDCAQLAYSDYAFPTSVPQQTESAFSAADFMPPVRTFYTVESDHDFMNPACAAGAYICWPTIAPSSLAVYASAAIPSWTGSFLLTSLKDGAVHRVVGANTDELVFRTVDRYRDLAISRDGRSFYVATDSGGDTRAQDGSPTQALEHRGAILEFRLQP